MRFLGLSLAVFLGPGPPQMPQKVVMALRVLRLRLPEIAWVEPPVHADLTGNGISDLAIVGKSTQSLVVAVIIGPIDSGSKMLWLSFPIGDPDFVNAACAAKASLAVEDVVLPANLDDAKPTRARPKGLRLELPPCDVLHLFWRADSTGFAWWRQP